MARHDGFTPAPSIIPCRDEWPRGLIRATALAAYKQLHGTGQITIRFPLVFFPDCLVIAYNSPMPVEWAREALRKAERSLVELEQIEMEICHA